VKIYLATRGEYSDYRVCHAFAKREDAESYKLGEGVLEMELHDGPVEVRYWYDLDWRAEWRDWQGDGLASANPLVNSRATGFRR